MTSYGTHPFLAAQLARSGADDLASEARVYRLARLARKNRRKDR